jgi:hypothetical protein
MNHGLVEQSVMNLEEIQDLMHSDITIKSRKLGNLIKADIRLFCVKDVDDLRNNPKLESFNRIWRIERIQQSEKLVPLAGLNRLQFLREHGIEFQELFIARPEAMKYRTFKDAFGDSFKGLVKLSDSINKLILPLPEDLDTRNRKNYEKRQAWRQRINRFMEEFRDPILLGRNGRYFVKICRWR